MHSCFFFFNDTATTEIYTLSLHDALPIYDHGGAVGPSRAARHDLLLEPVGDGPVLLLAEDAVADDEEDGAANVEVARRSEEHTSELQSPCNLVCRLLLEKKKDNATASILQ